MAGFSCASSSAQAREATISAPVTSSLPLQ